MIQTYQVYFQKDGRFISDNLFVQIPVGRRTIVTVLDDEIGGIIENTITDSQKQKEALNRLYSGLKVINDEPLDDEFDSFMSQGFNITRELPLSATQKWRKRYGN